MAPAPQHLDEIDPFDLPEWLGTEDVVWSGSGLACAGEQLDGTLAGPAGGEAPLACDLLAVDVACPVPVVDEPTRTRAHLLWRSGEVLLASRLDRLTLAVPGTAFTADVVLDALGRLARAVGADPNRYAALITVGR